MQSEKKAAIAAALLATFFTSPLSALAGESHSITELLSTAKSKIPHLLSDKKEDVRDLLSLVKGRHDRHHRYHRNDVCRQDFDADSLDVSSLSFENEFLIPGLTPGWSIMEGPVWKDGGLYMSHIGIKYFPELEEPSQPEMNNPSDLVLWKDGVLSTVEQRYGSNGLTLDMRGNLVAARHFDGSITEYESGAVLANSYDGARFNSPNDLIIGKRGDVYMTDPDWQANEVVQPQAAERAYHVDRSGNVTAISDGVNIEKPNGVYLSRNEKTLFVGGANGLFTFDVKRNGSVDVDSIEQVLVDTIPGTDGMTRDCAGNLWITSGNAVHVASFKGHKVKHLGQIPLSRVTNLAFGGEDGRTLYATVMGPETVGLYSVQVSIPGMPY